MGRPCRAPQGARGLKLPNKDVHFDVHRSRAPQGARGLKYSSPLSIATRRAGRAPQGARGLKYVVDAAVTGIVAVAPRKGRVG